MTYTPTIAVAVAVAVTITIAITDNNPDDFDSCAVLDNKEWLDE
jgi:hypothetical protein